MKYEITDGTLTFGARCILSHVQFAIRGTEKIALVGPNGAGKTTLLRVIAGELSLDADDRRQGPGIVTDRDLTIGMLHQHSFADVSRTVEEELEQHAPVGDGSAFDRERFWYEKEYDTLFTGFGFEKKDKKRKLSEFSGGEQTKIGLISLLLDHPDLLLLDEPTNHLDVHTVEWLEQYLKTYDRAVVMVSHDRFFLDETAEIVYELEAGKLTRYPGNYTAYRQEKKKQLRQQAKAYERYMEEKERLEELIRRFKNKPRKAAFARAKRKELERLPVVEKPELAEKTAAIGTLEPLLPGSKRVLEAERLQVGYEKTLLEITLHIRKGQKIAILGNNGTGKTTFLKTVAGLLPPRGGKYHLGNNIMLGYFDQHSAEIASEKSVLEHFHDLFPALTEKEARGILGAYLFGGKEAAKKVDSLSGGEKARLVLAELLQSRPNFLLLDEPTNHMDIQAKERLEEAFAGYQGTMLFISHDRYFIQQLADAVLIFEGQEVFYYPFGYRHYVEHCARKGSGDLSARLRAEEQALIDGMRAVPKAERHRLRELSTEEIYEDWRLQPAREALEEAARKYEKALEDEEIQKEIYEASEEFWAENGILQTVGLSEAQDGEMLDFHAVHTHVQSRNEDGYTDAVVALASARQTWHDACLAWYEQYRELEEEETDAVF